MSLIGIGPVALPRKIRSADLDAGNPGIGGTEFQCLLLARVLATEKNFNVVIIFTGVRGEFEEFSQVQLSDWLLESAAFDLLISPIGATQTSAFPALRRGKLLLVSHHPHEKSLRKIIRTHRPSAIVSVGQYQYYSNFQNLVAKYWIPGLSPLIDNSAPAAKSVTSDPGKRSGFSYVGSIHKAKGLHVIFRGWIHATKMGLKQPLKIVGSANLYTNEGGHISAANEFQTSILAMDSDCRERLGSGADFYGRLPARKTREIVASSLANVSNPFGIGEADPMVIQESICLGTPPISGSLFGNWDMMRHFPELQAVTHRQVSRRFVQLSQMSNIEYRALVERCKEVSLFLMRRRISSEGRWLNLVTTILSEGETAKLPRPEISFGLLARLAVGILIYGLMATKGLAMKAIHKCRVAGTSVITVLARHRLK